MKNFIRILAVALTLIMLLNMLLSCSSPITSNFGSGTNTDSNGTENNVSENTDKENNNDENSSVGGNESENTDENTDESTDENTDENTDESTDEENPDEELTEEEKAEAEKKKAENDALLAALMPKYEALRSEIASKKAGYDLGSASASIGTPDASWTAEIPTVKQAHPRLLLTSETLPTVKKFMKDKTNPTVARYYELLDTQHARNGKLGAVQTDFDGRPGIHNYDKSVLELIQVKALGYLVEGHKLYGYQAIHYMKQFLRTLDIQYIKCYNIKYIT